MAPATPDAAPAAPATPATASSSRKARGPFTRARTGCMTCRRRKMKCNEAKPICGPCSKSQRPCEWQEVTFRHQQNPMLNAADTSLSKFYRGTGTYTNEQLASFVQVKDNLQFAPTAIPGPPPGGGTAQPRPSSTTAQQMPDHTLQTLAAAAVQHPPYVPPLYESYPTYTPAPNTAHAAQAVPNTNISSLLNPSTTPTSMIDPNLESSINRNSAGADERAREVLAGIREYAKSGNEDMNETDTKLAHALQGFSDGQGQPNKGTSAKS